MEEHRDIAGIRAVGVLSEFGYDIDFRDETDKKRMRVIYAPNGRGKTNFLRAVSLLLNSSPDSLQELIEIPLEKLEIEFRSGAVLEVTRESAFSASCTVSAKSSDMTEPFLVDVDPADFAGRLYRRVWSQRDDYTQYARVVSEISCGSVLIGDNRLTTERETGDSSRPEGVYPNSRRRTGGAVSRLLERVERMLTQAALDSLSRENYATGVYADITRATLNGTTRLKAAEARTQLEEQISEILKDGSRHEKYGLLSLRQVREISQELVNARANNAKLPSLHPILKPFLDSLQDQIRSLAPAQQLIDTFVTAVNQFLDRKSLQFSAAKGIELVGRDNGRLDPESLSSGERHLLYLLSHAILATESRPLVIIDEPELSLGLDWQRDLLAELLRCSASARVQFLVASHSVQIMGNIDLEDIARPSEVDLD